MLAVLFVIGSVANGAPPNPVLSGVFPPGGRAGTTVLVTVPGANLADLKTLRCSHPRITSESAGPNQFKLSIPEDAQPGQYDLQAVTANGLSSTRTFVVSHRDEQIEAEPNNAPDAPQRVPLDVIINGRVEKGDLDHFVFTARNRESIRSA